MNINLPEVVVYSSIERHRMVKLRHTISQDPIMFDQAICLICKATGKSYETVHAAVYEHCVGSGSQLSPLLTQLGLSLYQLDQIGQYLNHYRPRA